MILDPNTGRDITSEVLNVRDGRYEYEIPITSRKPNGHGSQTIKTIDTVKKKMSNIINASIVSFLFYKNKNMQQRLHEKLYLTSYLRRFLIHVVTINRSSICNFVPRRR